MLSAQERVTTELTHLSSTGCAVAAPAGGEHGEVAVLLIHLGDRSLAIAARHAGSFGNGAEYRFAGLGEHERSMLAELQDEYASVEQ